MAQFTVKSETVVSVIDMENTLAQTLGKLENDIRGIGNSLGFNLATVYNLKSRVHGVADRVGEHQDSVKGMSQTLQEVLNVYQNTESAILGKKIVTDRGNSINRISSTIGDTEVPDNNLTKTWKKLGKIALDVLGKFGLAGEMAAFPISAVKLLVDGDGLSAKDWGSILKGAGNSGIGIFKTVDWLKKGAEGGWRKFFGFTAKSVDPKAGWLERTATSAKDSLKSGLGLEEVDGKYRVKGTKVAGWALSLVANGFANYDEYETKLGTDQEISKERAVAETITETGIDIAKGAALTAGIAVGCAALGVGAPAVVVGGAAVIVSGVADIVCEKLTGEKVTEFVSDKILDLDKMQDAVESAGKVIKGVAKSAKKAVSGWMEKVFGGHSQIQYAGA